MQVNRDEVIEEKGPLFEVDYHSILLSLWLKERARACTIEEEVRMYTGGQEAIGSTLNTVAFNQYSSVVLQSTIILPISHYIVLCMFS